MKSFILLASALLAGAPATAAATMTAKDFNLFVFNNATVTGSDTEGRVAVGNDASFLPYSVAAKAGTGVNLVVGHDLTYQYDTFNGSMVVGHNATVNGVGMPSGGITANGNVTYTNGTMSGGISAGGTVTTSGASTGTIKQNQAPVALPVDFAAEKTRLTGLSNLYATYNAGNLPTLATMGTVTTANNGGTVTLTGTGTGINVFNITGTMLGGSNTFNINLTGGGVALINVSGLNDVFSGGMTVNGSSDDAGGANVLFNFYQATSIGFSNSAFLGSILAPNATYNPTGWGHIAGQVVVNNWTDNNSGKTQVNDIKMRDYALGKNLLGDPWTPPTNQSAVPEPSTWATMVVGFGLLGAALRRGRRKTALA